MLTVLKKHLLRRQAGIKQLADDDRDDVPSFTPPASYIKLAQGKILLQSRSLEHDVSSEISCVNDKMDNDEISPSAKYIRLAQGKIVLDSTPTESEDNASSATSRDKQQACLLEKRLIEVETMLQHLQERFNSHDGQPTFEKALLEQFESMNRVLKVRERKQKKTCREYKALQTRFSQQENLLHALQHENKALLLRIRQYEHCLDDVMRKVVDAIVAEDHLRLEVVMLKSRVRDLEAQNAALTASPAKGRDEGYCTMSSGQPQPSNGHLEDLPEEPEQWLLPAEPCSTEMEDWSMSQEELVLNNLDEVRDQQQDQQPHIHQQLQQQLQQLQQLQQQQQQPPQRDRQEDWVWNSQDFLNSTTIEMDSVTDGISQLLQQKIIYSEDEEIGCTEFTDDFYKLVNIRSSSARSLYSYPEDTTDDEDDDGEDDENDECGDENDNDDDNDDDDDDNNEEEIAAEKLKVPSPTPSEAGRAQVISCSSSSETDDTSRCALMKLKEEEEEEQQLVESNNEILEYRLPLEVEVEGVYSEPTYCVIGNTNEEIASGSGSSRSSNNSFSTATTTTTIAATKTGITNLTKRNERNLPRLGNSWRKSHGWRRVPQQTSKTVGALVSPKRETTTTTTTTTAAAATKFNYAQPLQKIPPTRIPTCITFLQQQQQQPHNQNLQFQQQSTTTTVKQQQQTRKSKIPPPVPVRRSYSYAS